MRIIAALALLAAFSGVSALRAQDEPAEPAVMIHSLTIESAEIGDAERGRLVKMFQGGSYTPDELTQRVRQALRDEGYFKATAGLDGVKDSSDERSADITIRVTAGAQYHLGEIHFNNAALFAMEQLRALFPADGSMFNATAIGRGIEAVKELYAESGYLNFGAIPKPMVDEDRRTVSFTIDVDPGKRYSFGRLFMDGAEPKAGAAQSIQAAWANLHQKPYSPKLLSDWVAANVPNWPADPRAMERVTLNPNDETQQVDVVLELP